MPAILTRVFVRLTTPPTTYNKRYIFTNYTMATDIKFEGWLGKDKESVNGKMEWGPFEPKKWTEDDVDIEISHCGICGSDVHTLSSGWAPTKYRMII